jgi:hypothetical protein
VVKCWYHYFFDRQASNNFAAYLFLSYIGSILATSWFQAGCHPRRQKYVARPKQPKRIYRSHSTFQVGMRAGNWVSFMDICQEEVREYISLHPNKRSNYQRGKRAAKLIRTAL